ncbi:MAG TPA: condensation domain-containing protein, partial [Longimicrobiaceae bacterium]|nr:condensation domain-containing protein [Longimicrobiaceae bacterium]
MVEPSKRTDEVLSLIEDIYPLTPVQAGMLFQILYAPESRVYVNQYVFSLRGRLDTPALQKAWQGVLDRHPVLRTVFAWEGLDEPLQVVRRAVSLPWEMLDWRGVPPAAQRKQLESYLEAERERGFDLIDPPLMRVALIRLAEDRFELTWCYHHLLLDGWSLALVLSDVFAAYEAALRQTEPALPRRRPFRDYVAWLGRQDLARAEAFWREALGDFTAPTPLGVDRVTRGGPEAGADSGSSTRRLSSGATAALRAFAQQQRLTLNTVLQGAWGVLLSRYSGEESVVFGATVSGRRPELAGVEEMVGLFINTLPVRVRVEGEARVDGWLGRLQSQQAKAREHDHPPLTRMQGWSGVSAGSPLFESIVVFENTPAWGGAGGGGDGFAVAEWRVMGRSHYPLTVTVLPGDRFELHLEYESRRFGPEAVERILEHLEVLLEGITADPRRRLCGVSLLREAERAQVLHAWNATSAEYPRDRCVHELFTEQAARTPGAPAVLFEDRVLTYAELERRANRLAHHLARLGVAPEVPVGLCVERSPEMIVGLLGILKAGGAYLPLSPVSPPERLLSLLGDARAPVLVTQPRLARRLAG